MRGAFFTRVFWAAVAVLVVPITLLSAFHLSRIVENNGYARSVFREVMGETEFRVLSSGRSSDFWTVCTGAIVVFDPQADDTPPPQQGFAETHQSFGGSWQPAPIQGHIHPLTLCQQYFDHFEPETVALIVETASAPGAWYAVDASETFLLWAPNQGIAARIYFGD